MKEELTKISNEWFSLGKKVREGCVEYLREVLERNNRQICWDDKILPVSVTVCYDGGNHPEYASNVFSTVYGVKLEEGDLYLQIEDDDNYPVSSITTAELFSLCEFIDVRIEDLS